MIFRFRLHNWHGGLRFSKTKSSVSTIVSCAISIPKLTLAVCSRRSSWRRRRSRREGVVALAGVVGAVGVVEVIGVVGVVAKTMIHYMKIATSNTTGSSKSAVITTGIAKSAMFRTFCVDSMKKALFVRLN